LGVEPFGFEGPPNMPRDGTPRPGRYYYLPKASPS